ncbi:MAG: glycosyltransferase family 1 protein [Bacteroidetes bacterium]|nr:glycosyltransferase family 1 protein [Bacteroidota bacterium]
MRPNIYINGRFLSQKMTGVNRFAFELCKALYKKGFIFEVVAPKKIRNDYYPDFPVVNWGNLSGPLWEMVSLPLFLSKHENSFLLSFSGLGPIFYKNQVITIHDLAFLVNPEWFTKRYYWFYKIFTPIIARNAGKIITVSEFSKGEIMQYLGIQEEMIVVVNNAVNFEKSKVPPTGKVIEGKYLLAVSSLDPRKNLLRIIEAYKQTGIDGEYKLVLVGKSDRVFNMEATTEITERSLGYVSDDQLVQLYRNASLLIYPSLYEGFGIPPLEAMSLGCPVLISDIPVFREVFGDAGWYVDPKDTSDIRDGILAILKNSELRRTLINQGYKCAESYRWERSAGKVIEMVNEMLYTDE